MASRHRDAQCPVCVRVSLQRASPLVQQPDSAGRSQRRNREPRACRADLEPSIVLSCRNLLAGTVEGCHPERGADLAGPWIEIDGPDVEESSALGDVVEQTAIGRPAWLV